jgi:trans-2,3-dihydro-3-hydroxyanthranilate isomerase
MNIPFTSLMSFQSTVYAGNQLAVFLNAEHIPENQMQEIAAEINFAESTFITMNPDEATAELEYSLSKGNAVCRTSNYWDVMGIDE